MVNSRTLSVYQESLRAFLYFDNRFAIFVLQRPHLKARQLLIKLTCMYTDTTFFATAIIIFVWFIVFLVVSIEFKDPKARLILYFLSLLLGKEFF